jgi:hypothetical protein
LKQHPRIVPFGSLLPLCIMSQSTDGEHEDWFRSTLPYDHPLFGSSSSGSDYDTEDALSQPTTDEECVGSGWLESPPSLAFTPYSWSEIYPQSGCLRHSLLSCGPCETKPFVPTKQGYIRGKRPKVEPLVFHCAPQSSSLA